MQDLEPVRRTSLVISPSIPKSLSNAAPAGIKRGSRCAEQDEGPGNPNREGRRGLKQSQGMLDSVDRIDLLTQLDYDVTRLTWDGLLLRWVRARVQGIDHDRVSVRDQRKCDSLHWLRAPTVVRPDLGHVDDSLVHDTCRKRLRREGLLG